MNHDNVSYTEALEIQNDVNNEYIQKLHNWIKSDSVFDILWKATGNPTTLKGTDSHFQDLFNLSVKLREHDYLENEARNENFLQQLP